MTVYNIFTHALNDITLYDYFIRSVP